MMNLVPYIKAGYPILYLVTAEESRAEMTVLNAATETKRNLRVWSATEGFMDPDGRNRDQIEDPIKALNNIMHDVNNSTIYIMRDLHSFFTAPKLLRQIRDIARDFKQAQKTMIIITPVKKIPPELERDITVLEFDLPTKEEITDSFTTLYEGNKEKIGDIEVDEQERIVQAAMGLTTVEAENAFSKAIVEYVTDDNKDKPISRRVMKEKANAVKKTGILEYFEANQTVNDVGGLDNLKTWLTMRERAFSKAAREFGLPMPRGILLLGLPGCGKSLSAKAASNILNVPLIRFDIGRVFGGLVGESESNMRIAIQTAEAVGSCVLWIDEMEKAFAGMGGSGSTDGGTSQRVFGNFITWMQEKTTPCFIISTVNKIDSLPPELLRKGRFDEIFYVGLPNAEEREAIINIHIRRYNRDIATFDKKDITQCVKASEGFSGAELEEAIVSGLYSAFHHNRELNGIDILRAIKNTQPLSISKKEQMDAMALWAEKNAVNASTENKQKETKINKAGRQLELE